MSENSEETQDSTEEIAQMEQELTNELLGETPPIASENINAVEETEEKEEAEPTEEVEEGADTEGAEDGTEEVDIFGNLKALAGRVPKLQSDTDKTAAKVESLSSQIERLAEILKPKDETESEGLIEKLAGDNAEDVLDSKIEAYIQRKYGQELEQSRQARESLSFQAEVQNLAGDRWGDIEPAAAKVIQTLREAEQSGEEWASKELDLTLQSPSHLVLLAEKYLSQSVRGKAQAQSERRQATADKAGNEGKSASIQTETKSEKDIMKMSRGEAEKELKAIFEENPDLQNILD